MPSTLWNLIIYVWLGVSTILALLFTLIFMLTGKFIKPIITSKFSKDKSMQMTLNKDGSCSLSPLSRIKKTMFDQEGESFQEYKVGEADLSPKYYVIHGLRLFFRRENDLSIIDDSGKPAPIDQEWLKQYVERDRTRVLLRKKLFRKKAWNIPLGYIILAIVGIVVFYLAYTFFMA